MWYCQVSTTTTQRGCTSCEARGAKRLSGESNGEDLLKQMKTFTNTKHDDDPSAVSPELHCERVTRLGHRNHCVVERGARDLHCNNA